MTRKWPVQDAESRFTELLDAAIAEGPQIVTKHGVEAAVLLPIEQWQRPETTTGRDIKEWLLAPEARTENLTPPRRQYRLRPPPVLE